MTRCAIQFFRGNFLAAFKWNPLVFAALCGVIAFDVYALATVVAPCVPVTSPDKEPLKFVAVPTVKEL